MASSFGSNSLVWFAVEVPIVCTLQGPPELASNHGNTYVAKYCKQCCRTRTAVSGTFCLSGTGTGMIPFPVPEPDLDPDPK
jgi:hypothetical protein